MKSIGALRLIRDQEIRANVLDFFAWEDRHDKLFNHIDERFRTFSRSLQYPATDERFFSSCPPEVHPAACQVHVPGIDGESLWTEFRSDPAVHGMLRHLIRDTYRSRQLLTAHVVRADSLTARLRRAVEH
jgi:hypothetical protein